MATASERRKTGIPAENRDEETEFGRPAPIDEDVEGELNAALPEASDAEKERGREST
jgi:hypothetical protein